MTTAKVRNHHENESEGAIFCFGSSRDHRLFHVFVPDEKMSGNSFAQLAALVYFDMNFWVISGQVGQMRPRFCATLNT